MLAESFLSLVNCAWRDAFEDARVRRRAVEHSLAELCGMGRRTISQSVRMLDRDESWSSDYKFFSRSRWDENELFNPVMEEYLDRYPNAPVVIALDDTKLHKTGKRIPGAGWHRDPMSPPFHVNLNWGLRFLQASLIFPHHEEGDFSARGLPVRFRHMPTVKNPGKHATAEERQQIEDLQKQHSLTAFALAMVQDLRAHLDRLRSSQRTLLIAGDGSFCNRVLFGPTFDGVELLARCRKDARLCFPDSSPHRHYAVEKFTPEDVRQSSRCPWKQARIYFGSKRRALRFKEVSSVLWQRGAQTRPLRLLVLAPTPYKLSPNSRSHFREPAFLLTTDLKTSPGKILQHYVDRWQIEVNHRDEKHILSLGSAQVRSPKSISRQPSFTVASYSLLLLASLKAFGPGRSDAFLPLPKWRTRPPSRPSLDDLLSRLRLDLHEASVSALLNASFSKNIVAFAKT